MQRIQQISGYLNKKSSYKEDMDLMSAISDRAIKELPQLHLKKMNIMMDLDSVHEINPLRLKDLLEANSSNFTHDIAGILKHFDRTTKKLDPTWSPRYSKK